VQRGPAPGDGIRFEGVEFIYPGASTPALPTSTCTCARREPRAGRPERLRQDHADQAADAPVPPDPGRILLDGVDLQEWDETTLRQRIGVIFQDFARYQMLVGENIGAGDVRASTTRRAGAAPRRRAWPRSSSSSCPAGYRTQLGKWFKDGRELSGGQWQKIALARAFMRSDADILVLDEPTAAIDAGAEAEVFEHFRELTRNRIAIVISHRFSTVRMTDQILVLDEGRIVERGSHESLMAQTAATRSYSRCRRAGIVEGQGRVAMPSFDVVSEIDTHELTNAVDQASRELAQRFDFKDTGARFELRRRP
jgi:ATP-binding cassette, subfamily B, bacterial